MRSISSSPVTARAIAISSSPVSRGKWRAHSPRRCARSGEIHHRKGAGAVRAFWNRELRRITDRAEALSPELRKIGATIDIDRREIRDYLHIPQLKQLVEQAGMGGSTWRDQFIACSPILGELGEPGVYPPSSDRPGIVTAGELFNEASSRFGTAKRGLDPKAKEP